MTEVAIVITHALKHVPKSWPCSKVARAAFDLPALGKGRGAELTVRQLQLEFRTVHGPLVHEFVGGV